MRWYFAVIPTDCHSNAGQEAWGPGRYGNVCQAWKDSPTLFRTAMEGRI